VWGAGARSRFDGRVELERRVADERAKDGDTVRLKQVLLVVNFDNNVTDSHPIIETRSLTDHMMGREGDGLATGDYGERRCKILTICYF
jgi:hypothetical protein